ncbi:Fbox domain containing protein [Balamuthia mandrillaris]
MSLGSRAATFSSSSSPRAFPGGSSSGPNNDLMLQHYDDDCYFNPLEECVSKVRERGGSMTATMTGSSGTTSLTGSTTTSNPLAGELRGERSLSSGHSSPSSSFEQDRDVLVAHSAERELLPSEGSCNSGTSAAELSAAAKKTRRKKHKERKSKKKGKGGQLKETDRAERERERERERTAAIVAARRKESESPKESRGSKLAAAWRKSRDKGRREQVTIGSLPEEVIVHILSYLPHFPYLVRCSTVCRLWRRLACCEQLWRAVYLGNYEHIASDQLLVWIVAMNPRLEVLSLKGCTQVSDVGLTAALGRCSNLRELHLEDLERQFTVRCLLMIGKLCPNLHTLVLPGILEHPDEVIQPIIQFCPNLRVFKSFSQFSEMTMRCLSETCKHLKKLRLGTTTKSTILTQTAVKYLTNCPKLKSLECGYFQLGVVNWGKKPLVNFRSFRAFGWLNMSPEAVRQLLKSTPNLEVLHLVHSGAGDMDIVMDSFKFHYISSHCPNLRNINLCDSPFSESDVQVLVKQCPQLRELRVGMKSNPGTRYEITDSWIYEVINFSPMIEVLKVYHVDLRTETVSLLTRGCKHLRVLTLGRCSPITRFTSHLEVLTSLRKLSLRNTLTNDSALQMLMAAFPSLQTVTLIETGVSDALIGYILGRYRLRSLKLQSRARITNEGKILYRGRSSRGFAKKQTLSGQEQVFLSLFQTEQAAQSMIKKPPSSSPYSSSYSNLPPEYGW